MKAALLALAACTAPPPAPIPSATPSAKAVELGDLDRSADPCTDFYQFATGGWHAANPIPSGQQRWGRRAAARQLERRQLQDMLADLARGEAWPRGTPEQLLGDTYASCIDEAAVDTAYLAPLKPWLTEIASAHTIADVQRAMRRLHAIAIAAPFGVIGAMDDREPAKYVADVIDGGLGAPDRATYLHDDLRASYRDRVAHVLELAGTPARDADAIVALEARLAAATTDPPPATSRALTFDELAELAPHIDWTAYFTDANLPRDALEVADPAFLQAVDHELATTPVAVWTAYLRWQLLHAASPWLAAAFADNATAPRAARCVDTTEALFGELLGRMYARTHLPPVARERMQALMRALITELHGDLDGVTWLAPATKTTALAKVDAIEFEIGYPDRAANYGALAIHRDALWANVAAARAFAVDDDRVKIGKPTPRDLWQLPASSPDAYIEPLLDQIVLPAGYLQPPVFDASATDAMVYGAAGVSVAHDLTHSIDASGSELDALGRHANWWTDADRDAFAKRAQCVVEQFDGSGLDGKRVLSEAIGDLAGLHIAYAALQHRPRGPIVDGFTPEQQFFIAWAQFRGDALTPETERTMIASDPHPIPKLRIDGALANTPEFQRAFACKAPPRPRCGVW